MPGIEELADVRGLPDLPGLPALPLETDRQGRLAQLSARKAALASLDAQTTAALAQLPPPRSKRHQSNTKGATRHGAGVGPVQPPRKCLPLAPPGPWRHHFFRNISDSSQQELAAALLPRNEPRQYLLTPKPEWARPNANIVLNPIMPTHRYAR